MRIGRFYANFSMRKLWPMNSLYDQYQVNSTGRATMNAFIIAPLFGTSFGILTGGTVMTGFAQAIGADDFTFALMNALPILGSLSFAFFASWLIEKRQKRKKIMVTTLMLARITWFFIAAMPFIMPVNVGVLRIWTFITLLTGMSFLNQIGSAAFTSWFSDVIPLPMRGRYLALKSSLCNFVSMAFSLFVGFLLDAFAGGMTGYTIAFALGALLGVIDLFWYLPVHEIPMKPMHTTYMAGIFQALRDSHFWRLTVFWTVWALGCALAGPFFSMYALGPLHMSFTLYTLVAQVLGALTVTFSMPIWGKLLDRHGRRKVMTWSLTLASATIPLWLFAKPGGIWIPVLYFLTFSPLISGVDLTGAQMTMSCIPSRNRTLYMAIFGVITALAGSMLGTMLGGIALRSLGEIRIPLGFLELDRYKIVILAAGLFRFTSMLTLLPMTSKLKDIDESE